MKVELGGFIRYAGYPSSPDVLHKVFDESIKTITCGHISIIYNQLKTMSRKFQVKSLPCFLELQSIKAEAPKWLFEAQNLFVYRKSEQEKEEALTLLELRLNQHLDAENSQPIVLKDLAPLTKNSGFNALASRIFLQTPNKAKQIDSQRMLVLSLLKNQKLVQYDVFNSLYAIYKNIYLGKLNLDYTQCQGESWRKTLKSILTSLKKMMVLKTKKQKKSLKPTKDSLRYTVNLDVKHLIKCCEIKTKEMIEKTLNQKIRDMIEKTKNGWAGPRLWKIVYEQKWTTAEIDLFVQLFTNAYENYPNPRSDARKLKVAVERILENLNALSTNTPICYSETEGWSDMVFELPVCSKIDINIELRHFEYEYRYGSESIALSVDDNTLGELSFL